VVDGSRVTVWGWNYIWHIGAATAYTKSGHIDFSILLHLPMTNW